MEAQRDFHPDAVAIAFSHSGETEEAVSSLRTAAARGAFTVAVTNFPDSPLARLADATLATVARETRYCYGAMSSRMAHMNSLPSQPSCPSIPGGRRMIP